MNVSPLVNSIVGLVIEPKHRASYGKMNTEGVISISNKRLIKSVDESNKRKDFVNHVIDHVRWKELTPLVARELSDIKGIEFQASLINNQWVYYIRNIDSPKLKLFDAYRLCQAVDLEPTKSDYFLLPALPRNI